MNDPSNAVRRGDVKATIIFGLVALVLIFSRSVQHELDHDENVFVASGALIAHGLMPYRDFHYNHLPTLSLIYAGLFRISDHLLFAARMVSVASGTAVGITLFWLALHAFNGLPDQPRMWLAVGIGALFLTNPVFLTASGLAWNHDFATLMMLWAWLATVRGMRKESCAWAALGGILAALGATGRLTLAPGGLAFVVLLIGWPEITWKTRAKLAAAFTLGGLLAALPTLWFVAHAWRQAYFGNLQFPQLNTAFFRERGALKRMNLLQKLQFMTLQTWSIGHTVFAIVTAIVLVVSLRSEQNRRARFALLGTVLLAFCLFVGAVVPTPVFRQYLYAPMPLLAVCLLWAFARVPSAWQNRSIYLIYVAIVVSASLGVLRYRTLSSLLAPSAWEPIKLHRDGEKARKIIGEGTVLTLGPIVPLEGGLSIEPELATGPFAIRVASRLPLEKRREMVMLAMQDVPELIATRKPEAMMTSSPGTTEAEMEAELLTAAKSAGYEKVGQVGSHYVWMKKQ